MTRSKYNVDRRFLPNNEHGPANHRHFARAVSRLGNYRVGCGSKTVSVHDWDGARHVTLSEFARAYDMVLIAEEEDVLVYKHREKTDEKWRSDTK